MELAALGTTSLLPSEDQRRDERLSLAGCSDRGTSLQCLDLKGVETKLAPREMEHLPS